MSDAPFPPEAGDENKGRPRPTGLRLTDASTIAAGHLPAPDAAPQAPPAPASQAGEREQDGNPVVSDPPAAEEPRANAPPAESAVAAASPLPFMLPPSHGPSDDALPPMLDEFGPPDEDAGPLRFLRDPVKFVGAAVDPRAVEIAHPTVEPPAYGFEQSPVAPEATPQPVELVPDPAPVAEARAAPFGADVSPILSALDDAERHAQAAGAWPESIPFGVNIRVPRASPPADVAFPEAQEAEDAGLRDGDAVPHPAEPVAEANAADHVLEQDVASAPYMPPLPPVPPVMASPGPERPPAAAEGVSRPADPVRDAAAKIAAEATATTAALENLRRLLEHKLPTLDIVTPPRQVEHPLERPVERARERAVPPPSAAFHPVRSTAGLPPFIAPALPAPLPMPLAELSNGGRLYLFGFLAGFGLALVAGVMLYVFISIG